MKSVGIMTGENYCFIPIVENFEVLVRISVRMCNSHLLGSKLKHSVHSKKYSGLYIFLSYFQSMVDFRCLLKC